jgi:hypothetical protein
VARLANRSARPFARLRPHTTFFAVVLPQQHPPRPGFGPFPAPPNSARADFGPPICYFVLQRLRGGPKPLSSKRWAAMVRPGFLFLLSISCATAPVSRPAVLLPDSQTVKALSQCSRPSPKFEAVWSPSPQDLAKAEANLRKVRKLRAACCVRGEQIRQPETYYRQYAGVQIDGRKVLYLNAFAQESPGWESIAIGICDGGSGAWGAVFDPQTGEYSDLEVNGIA